MNKITFESLNYLYIIV